MQRMLREAPDPFDAYPTATDLPELLDPAVSAAASNMVVWEDPGGGLIGFATLHTPYNNLYYHFRPGALTDELGREMIEWAVTRLRAATRGEDGAVTLDAPAREDDTRRITFLRRHGFLPGDTLTLSMARSLREPFPPPQLPPGFLLRPLRGEAEVEAYVSTHRAAFGTEKMTVAGRMAILRQPFYRPELDLVAISPGGELAAFCVCSIDDTENERRGRNEGAVDIVGTRPEFQRRGLGRAMVLAGMCALEQHGVDTATLGVSSANTPAVCVYESLGFRTRAATRWYSRPLK
jgi:ribosomal protein S18 acetylase RimI-like enzyme